MQSAAVKHQYSEEEAEIRGIIDAVNEAHYSKDAAVIAGHYAADAALFTLAPPLVHHGMNLVELQSWLDSWDGPIESESRDLSVIVSGGLAFVQGFNRLGGNPKSAGGARVSFWMRATWCLRLVDGDWKIFNEHTSVPFYMDGSMRAAFDLEPE